MIDMTPVITPEVRRLISMDSEMIYAKDIAPIVRMKTDVIIKYAKDGTWNQNDQGKFIISGNSVKFYRLDFLRKGGWIPPEEPKNETLTDIHEELAMIRQLLTNVLERMEASA